MDVDEGENHRITYELRAENFPADLEYFRWDEKTGVVKLAKKLDKPQSSVFLLTAIARDNGLNPLYSEIPVSVEVRESNNKPPKFKVGPGAEIDLSEGSLDFSNPIATYTADSQIPGDTSVYFELVNGATEQTNQQATFRAVLNDKYENQVDIYQAKQLQYEKVNKYTLTIQVRNNHELVAEAQLNIKVKDENNQAPVFNNIESGSVLEHEPPGTVVMQVTAIDADGTYPNNKIIYKLDERSGLGDKFEIDEKTGRIKTKVEFDREEKEYYALTVIAEDGAPSSLLKNGRPNQTPNKFRIVIKDKNDNPPYFPQQDYTAEVPEDADVGSKVIEVKAKDLDNEASLTTYQIKSGNLGRAFKIEPQTGFIRVNKPLDYENIREYTLIVTALDGQYSNDTTVHIKVLNRNDMRPEFYSKEYRAQLKEEEIPTYPILSVSAFDPDIRDKSAPQNITYFLDKTAEISSYFAIDAETGALRIVKPLDRDKPNGFKDWTMFVFAKDSFIEENGDRSPSLENFVQVNITLDDINDNAPFLNMPEGLVWYENQQPGTVGRLYAEDYDEEENGPPFKFYLAKESASADIRSKFDVVREGTNNYVLVTKVVFDREQQKEYQIPILIEDNKGLAATSILKLVIGDRNDNPMKPGTSSIFVYSYEGREPDTEIGRVYVNDPDDWDLPDKTFKFKDVAKFQGKFSLNKNTSMITMLRGIRLLSEITEFEMEFVVSDPTHGQTGAKAVTATVNVMVKRITEEAVSKSGSIRLNIKPEKFISMNNGREKLTELLKAYLNVTYVDVFTVLPSNDGLYTDIRFAAHGAPYLLPEKMEGSVARRKTDLERQLGGDVKILMIHIDECLYEGENCEGSCYNELDVDPNPTLVMTNTTSFVGVTARVVPTCGCPRVPHGGSCDNNPCMNGGTRHPLLGSYKCECPDSVQFGPNCETLAASFRRGWSLHKGLQSCENTSISFFLTTKTDNGLLLYQGPSPNTIVENVTDFFALELRHGKLTFFLSFGSEIWQSTLDKNLHDEQEHSINVRWSNDTIIMTIDGAECIDTRQCELRARRPQGPSQFMNSNGPLQVGGLYFGHDRISDLARGLGVDKLKLPAGEGFAGCIKNLTIMQGNRLSIYSLGNPSDNSGDETFKQGCDLAFADAVMALNMNMNFLIGILVALAVILTVIIVMAVYRRRRPAFGDKDIDCDIRENIINYEDEGGGEGDQTGYDLSVLRMMAGMDNGGPRINGMSDKIPPQNIGDPPDIETFLDDNKDRIDADPEANPYDDLRHYAYEGDGNSGGSLSSLNSGEDDADLEFDYLHNFGPRFKKLADMYGRESDSDSDPDDGHDNPAYFPKPPVPGPGSESW